MTPEELKAWLSKHGLGGEGFAQILGVNRMAVHQWLKGKRPISLTTTRLCALFDKYPELLKEFNK